MIKWKLNKKTVLYLIIAFLWTWFAWISAYLLSHFNGNTLSTESTVFTLLKDFSVSNQFLPQLLFELAVYGPFIGFLVTGGRKNIINNPNSSKKLWPYNTYFTTICNTVNNP
ncbi:MAG TPA: hypothetical protein PLS36_02370 [Clostridia bacterium]|nr:hypothetical protein [Clostridia bacterium]HXK72079.1 hypothetical protein [Clostridia bacterium]